VAGGFVGDGGKAIKGAFNFPHHVAQDKSGNYYVSDLYGQRIRKIDTGGNISTYAGTGIAGYNGDGIPAGTAQLYDPTGLLFDSAGNLIVADAGNCRIRKIDTSGTITTIVGGSTCGNSGNGGPATLAQLTFPFGLTYDAAGNLYLSDLSAQVIRVVNTSGIINAVAGTGVAGYSGDGGPATAAQLFNPSGVAVDSRGNVYIADRANHRVRKVDATGTITTFAGDGQVGCVGDGGPAASANIGNPRGLLIRSGSLYIVNGGCARVRSVNLSSGIIQTYAGSTFGYDGDGHVLTQSQFATPNGMIFNSAGQMVLADSSNGRVRKAGSSSVMATIAGGFTGDGGAATAGDMDFPEAVAVDKSNNYYIADANGNRIRKVDGSGKITTIAGNGVSGYNGDGGPATAALLNQPYGIALDGSGNIYIADNFNGVIREITVATGIITTFASDPNFNSVQALKFDTAGNLYITDGGACVIWKVTPSAVVSVVAGIINVCGYNGDNILATTAQLNSPYGLTFDSSGQLYIADSGNNRVRKVNLSGKISTIAGDGNCGYSGDGGPPGVAELCFPQDVVLNSGATYIADTGNLVIRKISGNVITTWAGTGRQGYNGDGLPALSTDLDDPVALVKDSHGTIFELDDVQGRLRKIK
jgi:sugar lactone lactonase YvrE